MTATLEAKGPTETQDGVQVTPGIHQLAAECLLAAGDDWGEAARLLKDRILRDDAALDAVTDFATKQLVRVAAHKQRQSIRNTTSPNKGQSGESMANNRGLQVASRMSWFMYPLPGGKYLGDATKEEVMDGAQAMYRKAEANRQSGQFLERVAGILTDDEKPTREQVSEEEIEAVAV